MCNLFFLQGFEREKNGACALRPGFHYDMSTSFKCDANEKPHLPHTVKQDDGPVLMFIVTAAHFYMT